MKNVLLLILCALPLWMNAQVNDFHNVGKMKPERQARLLGFDRQGKKLSETPQFSKENPFENKQLKPTIFRAANATTQVLDSIVGRDSDGNYVSKTENKSDNRGNVILSVFYFWDNNTNDWVKGNKYEYEYDNNNNQTLYTSYNWDNNTNDWVESFKYESEYDNNNNQTLYASYNWDSNINGWVGTSKYEYEYDSNNNLTLSTNTDSWDSNTNDWVEGLKHEYKYDSNNNQIFGAAYSWDSNTNNWVGGYKFETEYDNNNNFTFSTWYVWDRDINDWVTSFKYEYEYDNNHNHNNFTLSTRYDWDSNINDWVKSSKSEYEYDSNNNRTLDAGYDWDSNINDWVENYKNECEYDSNSNLTLYAYYNWDSNTNDWVGSYKYECQYDKNKNQTLYAPYSWDDGANDWTEDYRNENEYQYDENNNILSEINNFCIGGVCTTTNYQYYYSVPSVVTDETQPAGADGKGTVGLSLSISSDATLTGSFEIQFPEGMTLDEELTVLSSELSGNFYLSFTSKGNNTWLIEIKPNGLKSSTDVQYRKIMDIAYKMDESVQKGTYEATITKLDFTLNDNTSIKEDELPITITVASNVVTSIENIRNASFYVYTTQNTLGIESPNAELITVYSDTGVPIYSGMKKAGLIEIPFASMPGSIFIIKGSVSGTIKTVK